MTLATRSRCSLEEQVFMLQLDSSTLTSFASNFALENPNLTLPRVNQVSLFHNHAGETLSTSFIVLYLVSVVIMVRCFGANERKHQKKLGKVLH